ncbi:MAG: YggT family protein [Armatimonadota bacterium]
MARYEIIRAIDLILNAYYVLLLIRVIFSWLNISRPHPLLMKVHQVAYAATEPLLRPIRNVLAKYQRGMPIDLSPLIAWLLIEFARRLLFRAML